MPKKIPQINTDTKPIPLSNITSIPVPKPTTLTKEIPLATIQNIPVPEYVEAENPVPLAGLTENMIKFGDKYILIKPTKLKYQRDRSAAFYRILDKVPLVDLLSFPDNYFDDNKSPDKMLFDWLIAVFDDPDFVTLNYDNMDADMIHNLVVIFKRLNHILDKEERKNQTAQVTSH